MTKKKDAEELNAEGLTLKQANWLAAYLESGNASAAYRLSYDCEGMNEASINVEASRLVNHPKLAPRILASRTRIVSDAVLSQTWVLERLMRNARIAMGEETVKLKLRKGKDLQDVEEVEMSRFDAAAANKALELLGKYRDLRLWVEQVETGDPNDFSKLTDEQLKERVRQEAVELGIIEAPIRNGVGKPN